MLSIIIPVYKSENTLHQCMESVLREAPLDSEIILVDDGSPDRCPEMCDGYARLDERVKVIHQKNSGASVARNTGLEQAIGDFVFFLDSDDYLTVGYFDKLLSHNADLVLGNFTAFYSDGTPDYYLDVSTTKEKYELFEFLQDFHIYFPTIFNFPWGRIYKREILMENNILFDPDIAINEDLLFNISYYSHCKTIHFVKDATVMYRQVSGSLSRRYYPQLFGWYIEGYNQIFYMLLEANAFTFVNEKHFYTQFFGNVVECILGSLKAECCERQQILKDICNTKMVENSLNYIKNKKMLGICFGLKKKNVLLLVFAAKIYVFLLNAKKFLRGILK